MVSRVRRAIVSAGAALIAVGVAMAGGFATHRERESLPTPGVARVVCEPDRVRLGDDTVLAQPDGVRFEIENVSRAQLLQLTLVGLDGAPIEEPIPSNRVTNTTFTIPPGPVTVACLSGRDDGRVREPALLTVLDTHDLWVSPDLSCEEIEGTSFAAPLDVPDESAVDTARRTVPGLTQTDVLAKPGYPRTRWHGDLLVVIREGETIGRVTRAEHEGGWLIDVDACTDAALA
jgi:hypothetical protein